jgi:hypothetical protein
VHEIRHEAITREIHHHHYYHRILPIVDVEVLPTKHFLPVADGGLVEISADQVQGRGENRAITRTAATMPLSEGGEGRASFGWTNFTAREFPETEGGFKRYTTPEGFERTETTWIHPPILGTGGRDAEQTRPMEFGAANDGGRRPVSQNGRAGNGVE